MVTALHARMTNANYVLPTGETMRLTLQCRDPREAATCQHIAFAYARDVGLHGLRALHVATCAAALAGHVVARGGGTLELFVADKPRRALQLRARNLGPGDDVLPPNLLVDVRLELDGKGATVLVMTWAID